MAEMYLCFLSKPTLTQCFEFHIVNICVRVLGWSLKIDFWIVFSAFAIDDGKKKKILQQFKWKKKKTFAKGNKN